MPIPSISFPQALLDSTEVETAAKMAEVSQIFQGDAVAHFDAPLRDVTYRFTY